ncbi:hypothetical protein [Candidatus Nitrosocosmicus hydrocola]|uniref:hypothetical protein n=1 Tax=Candidatus Nitrosocosmicus hydrocola TaxID=1826872 RepID=UPI0011E5C6B2|nr:hypothetical protein [Candidatus Nitrosocosmicus hydrocola]
MSEINKNLGKITSKITEHGAPVIEQLLDKLTGKGALVKYSFEDLNVEMPSATDPNGRIIGGGKMTIHGTITISARVQDINDVNDGGGTAATSGHNSKKSDYYDDKLENPENALADQIEKDRFKTIDNEPALKDYSSNNNDSS